MLLHVRPNLESCHVIDRHAKVVLAVYVLPAELNHVLAVAGNQTLCGRGCGKLRLPNMEVNGKGLFSMAIYDRLKIICISSCVDLKVKFLNSLTINGGATGYGMLLEGVKVTRVVPAL